MKRSRVLLVLSLALALCFWVMGQSDWHINRNQHNQLPDGRLQQVQASKYVDENGLFWELQPQIKNKFHQPDRVLESVESPYPNVDGALSFDPKHPNVKFLSTTSNGGSYEAILQPDGSYLTEGPKRGTYNYGHPGSLWGMIKHALLDVVPHFVNAEYAR